MRKKKAIKWTGGVGAIAGAITAAVVPIVHELKKDEAEIHKDENIINDLNSKILNQANFTHQITDDVRKTLTSIYKDMGEIKGKVSGLEAAINILIRSNRGHN